MKTLLLSLALATLAAGTARANTATCMDNHEEQAGKLFTQASQKAIAAALAKKGISLSTDAEKNTFDISAAQVNFGDDGIYGYFSISDGTLVTKDGTELLVEYKQTSFQTDEDASNFYLKPVLTSSGFDKEGNAIKAHCTLIEGDVRVQDKADHLLITNAKTARVLVRVNLPTKISLY